MNTLWRLMVLGVIVIIIYFATIGRDDFYRLLDAIQAIFQVIADNYLKK